MSTTIFAVVLLSSVGLIAGIAIFVANRILPKEDASLQKANEIKERLPGADCGACGKPGCFAYAQAVAKDVEVLDDSPCRILASDEDATQKLGEYLGIDLCNAGAGSKAVVHCTGDSPHATPQLLLRRKPADPRRDLSRRNNTPQPRPDL